MVVMTKAEGTLPQHTVKKSFEDTIKELNGEQKKEQKKHDRISSQKRDAKEYRLPKPDKEYVRPSSPANRTIMLETFESSTKGPSTDHKERTRTYHLRKCADVGLLLLELLKDSPETQLYIPTVWEKVSQGKSYVALQPEALKPEIHYN